jgi:glycosyltransferase involved in cell wall biosynthesis
MKHVMVICSGASDEPLKEVIAAASGLPNILFFLTGGLQARYELRDYARRSVDNIIALEYLPDTRYYGMMNAVDCIVCLTTREHTLLSGVQEALWIGKPVITSRTRALSDFLGDTAIFVDNDADSLKSAIEKVISHPDEWADKVALGRQRKIQDYESQLAKLMSLVN